MTPINALVMFGIAVICGFICRWWWSFIATVTNFYNEMGE